MLNSKQNRSIFVCAIKRVLSQENILKNSCSRTPKFLHLLTSQSGAVYSRAPHCTTQHPSYQQSAYSRGPNCFNDFIAAILSGLTARHSTTCSYGGYCGSKHPTCCQTQSIIRLLYKMASSLNNLFTFM